MAMEESRGWMERVPEGGAGFTGSFPDDPTHRAEVPWENNPERLLEQVQRVIQPFQPETYNVKANREDRGLWANLKNALGTLPLHPISLTQLLIQVGYEPNAPERRYSLLFRRHMYYYPGIVGYMRGIARIDGWRALFRGAIPGVAYQFAGSTAYEIIQPQVQALVNKLPLSVVGDNGDAPDTEDNVQTHRAILVRGIKGILTIATSKTLVQIVTHPLEVILMRAMAQHVGKETLYSGVISAAKEIYQQEGLSGFYVGLVPAIVGHLVYTVIQTAIWGAFEEVVMHVSSSWLRLAFRALLQLPMVLYFPRTYSYPYTLVSRTMMVNNCGLIIGMEPNMPVFTGWRDCYRYLKNTGNLYRGSVIIFPRFAYKDPTKSGEF